jgi:hypothetical protein
MAHAATLMFAVLMLRNAAYRHKPRGTTFYTALVLVIVLPAYGLGLALNALDIVPGGDSPYNMYETTKWFGMEIYSHSFLIASIASFTAWALLGAYRMLAAEMQYRQLALAWPSFVLFLCVYFSGMLWGNKTSTEWDSIALSAESLVTLSIIGTALYVSVFFDSIDIGRYRVLQQAWRTGAVRQFFVYLPWWISCFVLLFAATIGALTQAALSHTPFHATLWYVGAAYGFILRDVAIIHLLSFGGVRRVRAAFFVYIAVLYGLLPAIFHESDVMRGVAAMLPMPDYESTSLASAWLQMLLVAGLCFWRWQNSKKLRIS